MAEIKRSGRYKGKTRNLTQKQVARGRRVGKAGKRTVGKKEAKQAMKTIDIRDTTWKKASERTGSRAKGGIVVGKDGKPITGTVTLASGKTATYVRGKRVAARGSRKTTTGGGMTKAQAAAARRNASGGSRGAGSGGGRAASIPTSRVSPSRRQEGAGGTRKPTMTREQAARNIASKYNQSRKARLQQLRSRQGKATTTEPGRRKGERRREQVGKIKKLQEWDGTKWVTVRPGK